LYLSDHVTNDHNHTTSFQIHNTIIARGKKLSQSDGITFANNGYLYYGNIGSNAVDYWYLGSGSLSNSNQYTLVQNDHSMQWQDTFAFDNQGLSFSFIFKNIIIKSMKISIKEIIDLFIFYL
jgi:hypothetical protein